MNDRAYRIAVMLAIQRADLSGFPLLAEALARVLGRDLGANTIPNFDRMTGTTDQNAKSRNHAGH